MLDRRQDAALNPQPGTGIQPGTVGRHPAGTVLQPPVFIPPQLATAVAVLPNSGDWLTEVKYDGCRLLARLDRGNVSLWNRNGQDWTQRFDGVATDLVHLPLQSAWLDGEIIALDSTGRPSLAELGYLLQSDETVAPLRYVVFDLLFLDGENLRELPLRRRRERLQALLAAPPESLQLAETLEGTVHEALQRAAERGLEGVVLKRADSRYTSARTRDWLKLRHAGRHEFVVAGFTAPTADEHGFGALLLGWYGPTGGGPATVLHGLHYAGIVNRGFDARLRPALATRLQQLERQQPPFLELPPGLPLEGVHWVKPECVAELRIRGWAEDGTVEQPEFLGLREDKPARGVGRDLPEPSADPTAQAGTSAGPATAARAAARTDAGRVAEAPVVAGVAISHPGRTLFRRTGLTKLGLARYYEAVGEWLLAELRDRPLTIVRCPRGHGHTCFFQKHFSGPLPEAVEQVELLQRNAPAWYPVANSLQAVISLVQMGTIEFHTWGCRTDMPERPDRMVFDLDPGPEVSWPALLEGAQIVRGLLAELGLPSFARVTGGKGLHIEVPLQRAHSWDDLRRFSRRIANHLSNIWPDRFTAKAPKAYRAGRIFVDYLRNTHGATVVASWSVRVRANATVAVPIAWEELETGITPDGFTVDHALRRLATQMPDDNPWADYERARARITRGMWKRLVKAME